MVDEKQYRKAKSDLTWLSYKPASDLTDADLAELERLARITDEYETLMFPKPQLVDKHDY